MRIFVLKFVNVCSHSAIPEHFANNTDDCARLQCVLSWSDQRQQLVREWSRLRSESVRSKWTKLWQNTHWNYRTNWRCLKILGRLGRSSRVETTRRKLWVDWSCVLEHRAVSTHMHTVHVHTTVHVRVHVYIQRVNALHSITISSKPSNYIVLSMT